MEEKASSEFLEKTKLAFLWTRILNIPFWTIYNLLPIILYKDLQATPFQITAITVIKPTAALISPYWSLSINERRDRLIPNLIWANIFKFLPFLFFPWITNNWIFILSFGCYIAFMRSAVPAWMEIIKLNLKGSNREKVFAIGQTIDYLGSSVLPILFGSMLDHYSQSWRWIFFGSAIIGSLSTLLLLKIPLTFKDLPQTIASAPLPLLEAIKSPWKRSYDLLKSQPNFFRFQVGFLFGGSALMMIHTILPMYMVDVLHLSYMEIMLALAACKGIGYAVASIFWVKLFKKLNIFLFSSWVTVFAGVYTIFLVMAAWEVSFIYLSSFIYGVMQAGSEMSWHLSGPQFSNERDSSTYSATNVLTVGVRGCIAPLLANLIYNLSNSFVVMALSGLFCFIATERMRSYSKGEIKVQEATS